MSYLGLALMEMDLQQHESASYWPVFFCPPVILLDHISTPSRVAFGGTGHAILSLLGAGAGLYQGRLSTVNGRGASATASRESADPQAGLRTWLQVLG